MTQAQAPDPKRPKAPITLSREQEAALRTILETRGHILLTGKAGSGKSTVVNELAKRVPLVLCATTARAALHIGGTTVDRVFRFSRESWKIVREDKLAEEMPRLPDRILIDEYSMGGYRMSNLIAKIARQYRKQLIMVGDWAQASPVKEDWAVGTDLIKEATVIRLTENHRQSDPVYLRGLNKIREGVVDEDVRDIFRPCLVSSAPSDDRFLRLFALNRETDQYNHRKLYAFATPGTVVNLECFFRDLRSPEVVAQEGVFEPARQEQQMKESRLAHREPMRIGARIIMTVNDSQGNWVNGDTGVVTDIVLRDDSSLRDQKVDFWKPAPQIPPWDIAQIAVKLDRDGLETWVRRTTRPVVSPSGAPMFEIVGFPLRLGWAISIHKAQGMTVDRAFVDMSSILGMQGESKHGLAYVAFSRTRTLDGLKIYGWNDAAVYCAEAVKPLI